jgi:hypothetical protein
MLLLVLGWMVLSFGEPLCLRSYLLFSFKKSLEYLLPSTTFQKNIYKIFKTVMILLFNGKTSYGAKNGTGTIGANERATAGTDKFSGFEDSLKEGS